MITRSELACAVPMGIALGVNGVTEALPDLAPIDPHAAAPVEGEVRTLAIVWDGKRWLPVRANAVV